MSLIIARTAIEHEDGNLKLLLIGRNVEQLVHAYIEHLKQLDFTPLATHTHLISAEADTKTAKSHIQIAYIDEVSVLIAKNETPNIPSEEYKQLAVDFRNHIQCGLIQNEYIDALNERLGENESESPWIDRNLVEAPKTGEIFYAIDSRHGRILYTMQYSGDDFITDNESWSGQFRYWMPAIKHQRDY